VIGIALVVDIDSSRDARAGGLRQAIFSRCFNFAYQRTNIIAQAAVQVEAQAIQFHQRLIEQTNGGRPPLGSTAST